MKRNKFKLLTAVLALLLLLSGCINLEPEEGEETTPPGGVGQIDKNSIGSYQTMKYTYLTAVDAATLTTNLDPTYLLLANKQSALGADYAPAHLTTLTCATLQGERAYELDSRAAAALYAMLAEMKAAGISDIMVASAYRSYDYQVNLYNKYLELERSGISADARRVFGEDYIKAEFKKELATNLIVDSAVVKAAE